MYRRKVSEVILRAPETALWAEIDRLNGRVQPRTCDNIGGVDIFMGAGFHVGGTLIAPIDESMRQILAELVGILSWSTYTLGRDELIKWAYEAAEATGRVACRREYAAVMEMLTSDSVVIDGFSYYAHDFVYYTPPITKKMLPAALAALKVAWVMVDTCESMASLRRRVAEYLITVNNNYINIFAQHPFIRVEKYPGFGAECAEMARRLLPDISPDTIKMMRNGRSELCG